MCDSLWLHGLEHPRLPCPWDSPGKNTGVGCHFLLQCMKMKSESEVAQSYPTLSDPMDCSLPGSSIHGIFQARVLEWGAIALGNQKTSCGSLYCDTHFMSVAWNQNLQYLWGMPVSKTAERFFLTIWLYLSQAAIRHPIMLLVSS